MADKKAIEAARQRRATAQQQFDRLPMGPAGTRSSHPDYARFARELSDSDAEVRRLSLGRARERIAAVGNAIMGGLGKALDVAQPNALSDMAPRLESERIGPPAPLPPYGAAPSEVISAVVSPKPVVSAAPKPQGTPDTPSVMGGVSGATEGVSGQGAPAPAAQPAQAGAQPAQVDPQAQQMDADLASLREMVALPVPNMTGPVPLAMGERIAAGLIAALDPVSYQAIVLPEMARRQQEGAQQYQAAVQAQDSRIARQAQLLTLQQQARYQGQQIGVEREKIQAGKEERAAELAREQTQVTTALASMLPIAQRADRRVAVVAQGLRAVGLSGQADTLEQQYGEVTDIAKPISENPTAATKSQVDVFAGRLSALDRSIADAQNAVHAERVRRGDIDKAQKTPGETDISKYTWGRAALTAIRRARALVQQGHGGPESFATGSLWWTDPAHKHKELNEQWSMIEASVKPDKFGGALSPTENQIINGILAGTLSLPPTQLRALERLETIISGKLGEQESVFDFRDESAIVGRGYLTDHQLQLMQSKLEEGWTMASSPEQIEGIKGLEAYEGWVIDPDGFPIMISPDGRPARITPF